MLSYLPATQSKQNASPHTGSSVFFLQAVFLTASSTVTTRYGSAFLVKESAEYNLEHVQCHINIVFCILQTLRFKDCKRTCPKSHANIVLCILQILYFVFCRTCPQSDVHVADWRSLCIHIKVFFEMNEGLFEHK